MFTSLFQIQKRPVTVFSSYDKNAPALTASEGSLKTILKACLVTGYGDKAGLGWQMAFESDDKNSASFKSNDPAASGYYFKIDNTARDYAQLSAYQQMSAIDEYDGQIGSTNKYKLLASSWKLIGHSSCFLLLLDVDGISYPILFGDLPKEKKRVAPVVAFWSARSERGYSAGLQTTLYASDIGNGKTGDRAYGIGNIDYSYDSYSFAVSNGTNWQSVLKPACRFTHLSNFGATFLYEPILIQLNDGTWTILSMLQPCSVPIQDAKNLAIVSDTAIKAVTGEGRLNSDCVVPTDWWYI